MAGEDERCLAAGMDGYLQAGQPARACAPPCSAGCEAATARRRPSTRGARPLAAGRRGGTARASGASSAVGLGVRPRHRDGDGGGRPRRLAAAAHRLRGSALAVGARALGDARDHPGARRQGRRSRGVPGRAGTARRRGPAGAGGNRRLATMKCDREGGFLAEHRSLRHPLCHTHRGTDDQADGLARNG